VRHLAAADGIAWIAWIPAGGGFYGRRALEVVDVTDPGAPRTVGRKELVATVVPFVQGPGEVLARGRVAWVADGEALRVFEAPPDGGLVEHPAVRIDGDADYLADEGNLLALRHAPSETTWSVTFFDISDPTAPRAVAELPGVDLPFSGGGQIAARDRRLYIASDAVYILDTAPLHAALPATVTPPVTETPTPRATGGPPEVTPRPPRPGPLFLPAAFVPGRRDGAP
jgi:hypothetical protein